MIKNCSRPSDAAGDCQQYRAGDIFGRQSLRLSHRFQRQRELGRSYDRHAELAGRARVADGHGVPPDTDPEVLTRLVAFIHDQP